MATKKPAADASVLSKLAITLGLTVDKNASKVVEDQFKPLLEMTKQFSASSNLKDSIFSSDALKSISKLLPVKDFFNFQNILITTGAASKKMATDNGEFFNSLSTSGKMAINITEGLAEAFKFAGVSAEAAWAAATLGISAVIAVVMALGVGLYKLSLSVLDSRNELVQFDKIAMGLGDTGLLRMRESLNKTDKIAMQFGMNLQEVNGIVADLAKSGVSINRLQSEFNDLAVTTKLLSTVTGESDANVSSLFSGLIVKAHFSNDSLKALSNSLTQFNKIATNIGMANISFAQMKEAIESSGNAIAIAASKGASFADRMTKDLINLAGLANTLGISVSELNGKFEESGNLISSEISGFRTLLSLSGGATFNQMLSGQFDKTEAILKTAQTLKDFNKSFGGNLNLTAQIAEKNFGVSKETAIKLINMTSEQMKLVRENQQLMNNIVTDSTKEAYANVTGTLGDIWTKFKNSVISVFQIGIASNSGFLSLVNNIANKLKGYLEQLSNKEGPLYKMTETIGKYATIIGTWISEKVIDKLPGILETVAEWVKSFVKYIGELYEWVTSDSGGIAGQLLRAETFLLKIAWDMGVKIADALMTSIKAAGGIKQFFFSSDYEKTQANLKLLLPTRVEEMAKAARDAALELNPDGNTEKINASLMTIVQSLESGFEGQQFEKFGLGDKFSNSLRELIFSNNVTTKALISNSLATKEDSEASRHLAKLNEDLRLDKTRRDELQAVGDLTVVYDKFSHPDKDGSAEGFQFAGKRRFDLENEIAEKQEKVDAAKLKLAEEQRDHLKSIDEKMKVQQQPNRTAAPTAGRKSPIGTGIPTPAEEPAWAGIPMG